MANSNCRLADGFSLLHKLVLRLLFAGFLAVGGWAVFSQSAAWGWVYLAVVGAAQAGLVLPILCGHCPYPHKLDTCLFFPAGIIRRLAPYRGPRISAPGKCALLAASLVTVGLPQYWLVASPGLLIAYWALLIPFLAYFPAYMCRRCRHVGCPANQVRGENRQQAWVDAPAGKFPGPAGRQTGQ